MFVMPAAVEARGEAIGKGWAGSLTMGAGQFCTNPGVAIVVDGPDAEAFKASAVAALGEVAPQTMLTDGIADAYRSGARAVQRRGYRVARHGLQHAIGRALSVRDDGRGVPRKRRPVGRGVRPARRDREGRRCVRDGGDREEPARAAYLHAACRCRRLCGCAEADADPAAQAGRVLANGFSTGVEVSEAMVHGGPYPASTNFGATGRHNGDPPVSRPVSYQNIPAELLPADLG
jgi:NADP-dependent aldehyde dehydrogenase